MGIKIPRKLAQLLDVGISSPNDQDVLTYDAGSGIWGNAPAGGGSFQPLDSDLTAIAALSTTAFGRALLELADQAALLSASGAAASSHTHTEADVTNLVTDLGGKADVSHTHVESDVTNLVTDLAGKQPLDSDLTAIAALSTTAFGRGLLELANQAALLSAAGAAAASHTHAESEITNLTTDLAGKQPLDSDLTAIAALTPTNDDVVQRKAGAWTNRTIAQLLADLAAAGTTFQPLDSDLTSIAAVSTTSYGRALLALADGAALSALIRRDVQIKLFDDATAVSTGDMKSSFVVPPELNGLNLVDADAFVTTVSSSGTPTVAIRRERSGSAVDMLSTSITIDASEKTSYTAATPAAINGSNDDVATGDLIYLDVDVAGTGAKGLGVVLVFA